MRKELEDLVVKPIGMGAWLGAKRPLLRYGGKSESSWRDVKVEILQGLAPDLPLFDVQPMVRAIDTLNGLLIFKIGAALVGALGSIGLVLSVIGVYGVLSYSVSQRGQEIGIRIALGAHPGSIVAMVLRRGAFLVSIGLVIGIGATLAAARVVGSFLTVSPTDPLTYVTVTVILTLVALVACYLPARRTIRVDPIRALRYE